MCVFTNTFWANVTLLESIVRRIKYWQTTKRREIKLKMDYKINQYATTMNVISLFKEGKKKQTNKRYNQIWCRNNVQMPSKSDYYESYYLLFLLCVVCVCIYG